MTAAVAVSHLVKRFKKTLALADVSLQLEEGLVHGLFGHNGAGKTTLMSIVTAQGFATSGEARVYGQRPYENAAALEHMCFIREGQGYPNDARPKDAFKVARMFYPRWDQGLADHMIAALDIPMGNRIKRLSRGQNSAVGVTIGLAARADITFFDEPYLGLDAMARHVFYEALAESHRRDPRTVVLSSHLIDEVANLVSNVVVLDHGRVLIDQDLGGLLRRAARVIGPADPVARFAQGREVIHAESMGPYLALTVLGELSAADQAALAAASLTAEAVSLQQLIIHLSRAEAMARHGAADPGSGHSAWLDAGRPGTPAAGRPPPGTAAAGQAPAGAAVAGQAPAGTPVWDVTRAAEAGGIGRPTASGAGQPAPGTAPAEVTGGVWADATGQQAPGGEGGAA
ncbi:MAG: ABC transporter ATP-binding protein [Bifidobacteriaceae bacterium]|nr:ABC transporter ATP-binding protein [Bifidobacteriaceae bacterium]